jgi:actin-like ATPase involved in cell morphogenesis
MYHLGIDLGTTWTAAAVCRAGARGPEPVPLGEHGNAVASVVFAGPDGSFLLGEAAERRARSDPDRVVREFKRRIGDPAPVVVGREAVPAEVLAARFVAALVQQVARREGAPPGRIAVTHPAGWGPHRIAALRGALAAQGVAPVLLLTEPQAAAVGHAHGERVAPDSVVAVHDLGGGTFDAAVVRKDARGDFALLGEPEGLDRLGGVDFDEAVFTHVRTALGPAWVELDGTDPAVLEAVARLRRECTAAKEALSVDTVVHVSVMLPGLHTRVRLGRAEFEDLVRPAVAETVDALSRALASAGVAPADVAVLLLVGGSSRMPLVHELVSAGIGRPVAVAADPKGVIAAGAALLARGVRSPADDALAAHGAAAVAARAVPAGAEPVPGGAVRDATVRDAARQRAAVGAVEDPAAAVPAAPPTTAVRPPRPTRGASAGAGIERARQGPPRIVLAAVTAAVLALTGVGAAVAMTAQTGASPEAPGPTPAGITSVAPEPAAGGDEEEAPAAPREPAPAGGGQGEPRPRPEPPVTTEPPTTPPTTTAPPTTTPTTTPPTTPPEPTGPEPTAPTDAPSAAPAGAEGGAGAAGGGTGGAVPAVPPSSGGAT